MKSTGRTADQDYVRRVKPGKDAGFHIEVDRKVCPPSITTGIGFLFTFYGAFNIHESYSMLLNGFTGHELDLTVWQMNYEAVLFALLTILFALQGVLSLVASFVILFTPGWLVPVSLAASAGGLICVVTNGLSSIQPASSPLTLIFYLVIFCSLCSKSVRMFLRGELVLDPKELEKKGKPVT